MENLVLSEIDI